MTVNAGSPGDGLARELRGRVLWLALDRPRASNAVDGALARAFSAALVLAAADSAVAAVVMTGGGDRVFSAGIDVKNPDQLDHEALSAYRRNAVSACLAAIVDFEKPLVAAVNGPAIGLGCMLALLTDQVIAAEQAAFSLPEIEIGIPTFLGISILSRAAGSAIARDLVLSGRRMVAAEAKQRGLVTAVVAPGELTAAAQAAAETLAAKPATTFALNKRWLARGLREELAAANAQSKAVQPQLAAEKHAAVKH
jgi:enoyl-CoA hydratase/carnithine racemase